MTIHRQDHLPLDPKCEVVAEYAETLGIDLTARSSWADGETWAAFERRHRRECDRCALYGVKNMHMNDPLGIPMVF